MRTEDDIKLDILIAEEELVTLQENFDKNPCRKTATELSNMRNNTIKSLKNELKEFYANERKEQIRRQQEKIFIHAVDHMMLTIAFRNHGK